MDYTKKVMNKLKNKKYIMFDFFDTLVHRKYNPDTLKQLWAKELEVFFDYYFSAKDLYDIRISSELYVSKNILEYKYDELLEEIYNRILNTNYVFPENSSKETVIQKMRETELLIESESQYLDVELYKIVKELNKWKVKLVIVSDFYFGEEIINHFMTQLGIAEYFSDVFVSCDYSASKGNTKLYDEVLKKMGVGANECFMIGDNWRNDYVKARLKGIKAYHRKFINYPQEITYQSVENEIINLYKKEVNSFYDAYGFSLFYFTQKLCLELKRNHVKDVFFQAREGQFLKKIFEYYLKKNNIYGIRTHYLYVSRRATYLPSLNTLEKEDFSLLFGNNTCRFSVESFLSNLNFNEDEKNKIRVAIQLTEEEFCEMHHNFQNKDVYRVLCKNQEFYLLYEKNRKAAKAALNSYLRSFDIDYESDGMTIVDVGWKGTIQDNIFSFFNEKVKITGYYLGLQELTKGNSLNQKRGVLYSKVPFETKYYRQWSGNRLVYENILHASHPSVKMYQIIDGRAVPIYDESEDHVLFENASDIQERMLDVFERLVGVFSTSVYTPLDVQKIFVRLLVEAVNKVSSHDIKVYCLMDNAHFDNFMSLKIVKNIRSEYDKKTIVFKYVKYLKNINQLITNEYYLKTISWMYQKKLFLLIPIYKKVVYHREKKLLRKTAEMRK